MNPFSALVRGSSALVPSAPRQSGVPVGPRSGVSPLLAEPPSPARPARRWRTPLVACLIAPGSVTTLAGLAAAKTSGVLPPVTDTQAIVVSLAGLGIMGAGAILSIFTDPACVADPVVTHRPLLVSRPVGVVLTRARTLLGSTRELVARGLDPALTRTAEEIAARLDSQAESLDDLCLVQDPARQAVLHGELLETMGADLELLSRLHAAAGEQLAAKRVTPFSAVQDPSLLSSVQNAELVARASQDLRRSELA